MTLASSPTITPASRRGVVLLAHGSSEPGWRDPVEGVAARVRSLDPTSDVRCAYLGGGPELDAVVTELLCTGIAEVTVVAAFLSAGGRHLRDDVPRVVAEVAARHPSSRVRLVPGALGAEPEVQAALAEASLRLANTAWG
jgi:sirohydrochlorin cobaltochelatase